MFDKTRTSLDEQLIQSQKLASIGELSAGIAHEINNPLAVIGEEAGWIQDLLKRDSLKDLKELDEFKDSLREIGQQAGRCKEITHKLLSFARKMESVIKDVDLNKLIDDVMAMRERDAKYSNISFVRKFHPNLPMIYSDPSLLRQVFLNLVNNAMDAIQKGEKSRWRRISARATRWRSESAIPGWESPRRIWAKSLILFLPPNHRARGPGWGCPSVTGSWRNWGGVSPWPVRWAREPLFL